MFPYFNFFKIRTLILLVSFPCLFVSAQSNEIKPKYSDEQLKEFDIIPGPALKTKALSFEFKPFQADMRFNPELKAGSSPNISEESEEIMSNLKSNKDYLKHPPYNVNRIGHNDDPAFGPIRIKVGTTFYADIDGACPNDNTIAISKSGRIISMMNQYVGIYTSSGTKINIYTLENFFNNYMNSGPCDPKVEYDPVADRFFMFLQDCNASPEKIAFGFSKTNDPNGNWFIYIFDSDGLQDGSWSDYPKVAINSEEIFVSMNLFPQNGGSYRQSIVYQLDKSDGYAGLNMNYKIWTGFQKGTILPIRSGDRGLYGPGIYCVQTASGGDSYINYYDITGSLSDASSKLIYKKLSTTSYEPSGNAYQKGTSYRLDIGDCRGMDGFYQSGLIHFVFSADDQGYSGIRYHRLDPKVLDGNKFEIFSSSDLKDYCYPSISAFTSSTNDQTAVIHFAASGENDYPEMRAKIFHSDFSSDPSILIKQGPGPQTNCYNSTKESARWGDYSGIARHYSGSSPKLWVAGSVGNNTNGKWWTYIAEINSEVNSVSDQKEINSINSFPNPAIDRINFTIEFNTNKMVQFNILDDRGQLISEAFKGALHQGSNNFSITTQDLTAGSYLLQIITENNEIIKTEKFVVLPH